MTPSAILSKIVAKRSISLAAFCRSCRTASDELCSDATSAFRSNSPFGCGRTCLVFSPRVVTACCKSPMARVIGVANRCANRQETAVAMTSAIQEVGRARAAMPPPSSNPKNIAAATSNIVPTTIWMYKREYIRSLTGSRDHDGPNVDIRMGPSDNIIHEVPKAGARLFDSSQTALFGGVLIGQPMQKGR